MLDEMMTLMKHGRKNRDEQHKDMGNVFGDLKDQVKLLSKSIETKCTTRENEVKRVNNRLDKN